MDFILEYFNMLGSDMGIYEREMFSTSAAIYIFLMFIPSVWLYNDVKQKMKSSYKYSIGLMVIITLIFSGLFLSFITNYKYNMEKVNKINNYINEDYEVQIEYSLVHNSIKIDDFTCTYLDVKEYNTEIDTENKIVYLKQKY